MLFVGSFSVFAEQSLFQTKLDSYVEIAKTESKKNISEESAKELASMVSEIINFLEKYYTEEKLKSKKLNIKYNAEQDLPDFDKLNLDDLDNKIMHLIFATYVLYKNLDQEMILKIVKKSPLEFVPILKEIRFILDFCSTSPQTFGNAVISEKSAEGTTTIYVSKNTVERIAKPLAIRMLPSKYDGNIYVVSRIVSFVSQSLNKKIEKKDIDEFCQNMKRNSADDNREKIYTPALVNIPLPELTSENKFDLFLQYINKYQTQGSSEQDLNEALKIAQELIGIKSSLKIPVVSEIDKYCENLNKEIQKNNDKLKETKQLKSKLKITRDNENLQETIKFLKSTAKIFEAFHSDQNLLRDIIKKDPFSILQISRESIRMLKVLMEIKKDPQEIETKINLMRDFSNLSEDGTNLLSTFLSWAMNGSDLSKIRNSSFENKNQNIFLKIR